MLNQGDALLKQLGNKDHLQKIWLAQSDRALGYKTEAMYYQNSGTLQMQFSLEKSVIKDWIWGPTEAENP